MNEETRRHFALVEKFRAEKKSLEVLQRKARVAVQAAVRRGDLVAPVSCARCGRVSRVSFHHHMGYTDEFLLVGEWLCGGCHQASAHPEIDDLRVRMTRAAHECNAWVVGTLGSVTKSKVVIDGSGRKRILDGESTTRWIFFDEEDAVAFSGNLMRLRRDNLLVEAAALNDILASLGLPGDTNI